MKGGARPRPRRLGERASAPLAAKVGRAPFYVRRLVAPSSHTAATLVTVPFGEQFGPILAAAKTGSEWALAALYRELHPGLLRYLQAQEPNDGEDLATETWLDAADGLNRFQGDEWAFRRWLFTIARRRLIDHRRRRGRTRYSVNGLDALSLRPAPDDTEHAVLAADETETALARIAALPPDQGEVILLRVLAGLDVAGVAEVLGKKPGAVRVLQHRALRRLAEEVVRDEAVTR
jgi:RNA polymerase sigma-70 factor, ECF subfamily